jgi:hypothetical protein
MVAAFWKLCVGTGEFKFHDIPPAAKETSKGTLADAAPG